MLLGYVPVVNRGQRDIESKKSITKALDAEREYFENHPSYKSKAQYCGTPFLARKLNMVCIGSGCDDGSSFTDNGLYIDSDASHPKHTSWNQSQDPVCLGKVSSWVGNSGWSSWWQFFSSSQFGPQHHHRILHWIQNNHWWQLEWSFKLWAFWWCTYQLCLSWIIRQWCQVHWSFRPNQGCWYSYHFIQLFSKLLLIHSWISDV